MELKVHRSMLAWFNELLKSKGLHSHSSASSADHYTVDVHGDDDDCREAFQQLADTCRDRLKIYYGRVPDMAVLDYNIDRVVAFFLQMGDYEEFVDRMLSGEYGLVVHTVNPLVLNYLDDAYASAHVYWFDSGVERPMSESPEMMDKLKMLGPGEVVADSVEFMRKQVE